ncbi:hypothetical protein ACROYT_G003609 [Oculina patagonica]
MQHDVDYSVCANKPSKDQVKCKNEADKKMVKALDAIPWKDRQWGHAIARNTIATKAKVVNGEVPCKFCVSKQRKIEYDLAHQPTPVERNIIQQESEIFITPESSEESDPRVQHVRSSHSSRRPGSKSSGVQQVLPKRDLATKYFGEHLFSLPVSVTGSESVLSANKTRRKR